MESAPTLIAQARHDVRRQEQQPLVEYRAILRRLATDTPAQDDRARLVQVLQQLPAAKPEEDLQRIKQVIGAEQALTHAENAAAGLPKPKELAQLIAGLDAQVVAVTEPLLARKRVMLGQQREARAAAETVAEAKRALNAARDRARHLLE